MPGAWLCGWLAFRWRAKIETLALSDLTGLGLKNRQSQHI
ncbi:MAG: hypothetical protein ACKO8H_19110 [Microcystis panniformis]